MRAMILAAGLGTRLRPYSNYRPKPLFPLLDRPIILHLLKQLRSHGFGPIIVNAHYLREQFAQLLQDERDLHLQLEEVILGTGGGLRQALPLLGSGPVLVVNGDTLFASDLVALRERHLASGARVSLVVHDQSRFNNLRVRADNLVTGFRVGPEAVSQSDGERLLAFTGLTFLEPAILQGIPAGSFCDIVEHYIHLLTLGEKINALDVSGHFWADIGTPADYLALHGGLLRGRLDPWPDFLSRPVAPVFIGPGGVVEAGARLEEWAMIGAGARIGAGAVVRRSVIWDGAKVAAGEVLEDRIVVA